MSRHLPDSMVVFPQSRHLIFRLYLNLTGEGRDTRFILYNPPPEFEDILQLAKDFEDSGHTGFIIQEYIPSDNRSLRVVVIGQTVISYWACSKQYPELLLESYLGSGYRRPC